MINLFKKPITYFLTGSFSVILAACYGTPIEMQNSKIIKTKNDKNEPIPGLKVTLQMNGNFLKSSYTDNYGVADFKDVVPTNKNTFDILIEDVDGELNGGLFKSKNVTLASDDYYEVGLEKQ